MALVIPNAMKEGFLSEIKWHRLENGSNKVLCGLYTNDLTPTVESVAADFIQPVYSNYQPQQPIGWSKCYINLEGNAETDAAPLVWEVFDTELVPFTAHGYFLYDEYQNLLWAELMPDGPISLSTWGQQISLLLVLTFGICPAIAAKVAKAKVAKTALKPVSPRTRANKGK